MKIIKSNFKNSKMTVFMKMLKTKCKVASVLAAMFIFSVTTVYAAPQYNSVQIIDGDYKVSVFSDKVTVMDVIIEQGIQVTDYDIVSPGRNSIVKNAQVILIERVKRVDVTSDGQTISYWTTADTFNDFVMQNGIEIAETDLVSVPLSQPLDTFNTLAVTRVKTVRTTIAESIPYTTTTVYDGTLADGKSYVKTAGVNGTKNVDCEIVYYDGVEQTRTVYGETVVAAPVNEVVCEGVAGRPGVKTVNGQMLNYSRVINCSATAYDLSFESTGKTPGQSGFGITASGTYAKRGTVAVDPRVIPLGTKMYIESADGSIVYGICTAEDTGGAIKGNKVDLFYNSRAECMQFGRRNVNVYILQ